VNTTKVGDKKQVLTHNIAVMFITTRFIKPCVYKMVSAVSTNNNDTNSSSVSWPYMCYV